MLGWIQAAMQQNTIIMFVNPNFHPTISRYDISNCLFQAAYEKILEECQCMPYFHWGGMLDFCRGLSLKCMNRVLGKIGQYNQVDGKPCLASCEDQKNSVSITTSR